MGTRGAFGARVGEQDKVTYNHFDSYPEGLGADFIAQLKELFKEKGYDVVKAMISDLELVESESKPTKAQQKKLAKFADTGVSGGSKDEWYVLLRNTQGDFPAVLEAGFMIDSHSFLNDSLFCEFAYIANFDSNKFEVYRGWQKEDHDNGRYAKNEPDKEYKKRQEKIHGGDWYRPVALIAEFPLKKIPKNWMDKVNKLVGHED